MKHNKHVPVHTTAVRSEYRQTIRPIAETWPSSCCSHVAWPPSWSCPTERESQVY